MSAVSVTNVTVFDNPAPYLNPFQFEISYECHFPLAEDLEWKLIYIGSAEDEKYDQVLESVLVGPVNVGNYRFIFQADPPDASKIPEEDILGVTVMLLTCSYKGQEFVRIGYYVNNDYADEKLREEPPMGKVLLTEVQRSILADKPRVTKFPIPAFIQEGQQKHHLNEDLTNHVIMPLHPDNEDEKQGGALEAAEEEAAAAVDGEGKEQKHQKDDGCEVRYSNEQKVDLGVESAPLKKAKKDDFVDMDSPQLKLGAADGLPEAPLLSSVSA